ncbi:DUF6380 family protein, partial [Streptomyces capoamus]|uniref:DUF6380 family protein n=1 Tax=Streptomyces capoamus TaxID=68183 RepID=UPI00339955DE
MHRTAPEPAGRDGRRQATLACGVASLTATAGRASLLPGADPADEGATGRRGNGRDPRTRVPARTPP